MTEKDTRRSFLAKSLTIGSGLAVASMGRSYLSAAPQEAASKRIKVGVITHEGGAHVESYLTGLAECVEAGPVVLADSSGKYEDAARKTLGDKLVKTYSDYAEMLRAEKPIMVLISMEAALAPPVIDAALEANCHVLAEKPACVRIKDFEALAEKANRKNLHIMLAMANRRNPVVCEARRLIRTGTIGEIYSLEMYYIADQTRLKNPSYHTQWYAQKARGGGGHLTWLGIHWLDTAMFVTGSRIREVSGFAANVGGQPMDVEDSAVMAMRFDNGTFGTLNSGYYLDRNKQISLKVWGSQGWLQLEPLNEIPLTWYSTKDAKEPKIEQYQGTKDPSGYTSYVIAAVRACAGPGEPPMTTDESLHVLETIFTFYQSAETGEAMEVK
ncbi:MAG TPA: Gfo/Idh/MocA family oxidoreductase [bacterium]|nr:Gfo/Idh/MocA family oxidoreductase [bacterium]